MPLVRRKEASENNSGQAVIRPCNPFRVNYLFLGVEMEHVFSMIDPIKFGAMVLVAAIFR